MPTRDELLDEVLVQGDGGDEEFLSGVGGGGGSFFGGFGSGIPAGGVVGGDADAAPQFQFPLPAPPALAPTAPPPPALPIAGGPMTTIVVTAPAAAGALGMVGVLGAGLLLGESQSQVRLGQAIPMQPPLADPVPMEPPAPMTEIVITAPAPAPAPLTTVVVTAQPTRPGVITIIPDWLDDPFADPMTRFSPPIVENLPAPARVETMPAPAQVPFAQFFPLGQVAPFTNPMISPLPGVEFAPLIPAPAPVQAPPVAVPAPQIPGFAPFFPSPAPSAAPPLALPQLQPSPLTFFDPTPVPFAQPSGRLSPPVRRRRTECECEEEKRNPCERGYYRTDREGKLTLRRWRIAKRCF